MSYPGLSALQLASVALKSVVGNLEKSVTVGHARLHSLHKEQMMETLKCLLQMECNLQCLLGQDWATVGQVSHTFEKVPIIYDLFIISLNLVHVNF